MGKDMQGEWKATKYQNKIKHASRGRRRFRKTTEETL
jgi:hypothetical protein